MAEIPNSPSGSFTAADVGVLASEQVAKVHGLFRRMGLANVADDLFQDTSEKALKSIHTFRGDSKASTWFYRVAQTVALDFLRKKKRSPQVMLDTEELGVMEMLEGVDSQGNPETIAIANQKRQQIVAELAKLPAHVLQAIDLSDIVDVSSAAKSLKTSNNAIHSRVSRLRKKLIAD